MSLCLPHVFNMSPMSNMSSQLVPCVQRLQNVQRAPRVQHDPCVQGVVCKEKRKLKMFYHIHENCTLISSF